MSFFDDKAYTINDLIAAVEAIETELGIVPSGVYANVRARLDIVESRINNPNAPAPDVLNPFFIGNTGVTIQAGFGDPNIVVAVNPQNASLFLREDGYSNQGLYQFADGYWYLVNATLVPGGDLSGNNLSQTVIGIQGRPVSATAPTTGQVLEWSGSNWAPSTFTTTLSGDVTGPIGSNTIASIQGVVISGTPAAGYVLEATSAIAASWQAPSGDITLAGDVTGAANANTVAKINGASVPISGSLTTGNVLQVSGVSTLSYGAINLAGGTNFVTGVLPTGNQASQSLTLIGDTTGSGTTASTTTTVVKVNGTSVPATPSVNQVLVATSGTTAIWEQIVDAQVSNTAALSVSKLASGTSAQVLLNNATPTPTWTTISGDATISAAGSITNTGLRGISVPSPTGTNTVLTYNSGAYTWGAGGGSGSAIFMVVNQTSHGFTTGQAVYYTGSVWALAEANSAGTLGIGIVSFVDANNFNLYQAGLLTGLSGLTAGQYYFVSDATSGLLTSTQPTSVSSYSNPLLFALSTTTGLVLPFRPSGISGSINTITQIKSSNYTVVTTDADIFCDLSGAAFTLTLPASPVLGETHSIKDYKGFANTNNLTISGNSNNIEQLGGSLATSLTLNQNWGSVTLEWNNTNWSII